MAGYEGDGSYQRLIKSTYGMNKTDFTLAQKYKEYYNLIRLDELTIQFVPSFIRSCYYGNTNGMPVRDNINGLFSTKKAPRINRNNIMYLYPDRLNISGTADTKDGFSVRCEAK